MAFEPAPGLLAERFAHANPWNACKSVMRLRHVNSMFQVHFPLFDGDYALYDTAFNRIEEQAGWHLEQRTGAGGWTEHFWTKSFAEFLIKKRQGEALGLPSQSPFLRPYERFFEWSQPRTPENYAPWPDAMLAHTKQRLARFAAWPGYAALQARWEAGLAAHTAAIQADAALRRLYDEMRTRFAK